MYPTSQQIEEKMEELPDYEQLRPIFQTLKEGYSSLTDAEKFERLKELIHALNSQWDDNPVIVRVSNEGGSRYVPLTSTIVLTGKPSIITALHELSHHLYGASELMACAFSIKLFSTFFPIARKKLRWQGHMLVKAS